MGSLFFLFVSCTIDLICVIFFVISSQLFCFCLLFVVILIFKCVYFMFKYNAMYTRTYIRFYCYLYGDGERTIIHILLFSDDKMIKILSFSIIIFCIVLSRLFCVRTI